MRNEPQLTPGEQEFVEALRTLQPTAPASDMNQIMYDAGHAAARRSLVCWRAAAAFLLIVGGLSWFLTPQTRDIERIVYVLVQPELAGIDMDRTYPSRHRAATAATPSPSDNSYLYLQRRVLNDGLDALPETGPSDNMKPVNARNIDSWLEREASIGTGV